MKKTIFILAALAAFASCNKNNVPELVTRTSECVIYAEDVNTKTVTDASFNVTWTDTDNLAVYTWTAGEALPTDAAVWRSANPVNFVAEAGNLSPKPFKLSQTDDEHTLGETSYADRLNAFKTRFGEGTTDLNWGVIYPGKMANASKPGMGIVVFGDETKVRSRQEGNDNMDHLAFQDVLWGKATGTAPTVQMKHLGTMMVYTVSNATSSEFTVTSIKITVNGANIGGQFRFNVFEGTFDSCMSALHECTLWVNNASAIPAGGSAKFYQVLAPFSLNAGNKITMTVVTDKGTWSKEMTLSAAKSFESGKKNTATLPVEFGSIEEDVVLTQHNTGEVWFSTDSNSAGYWNLRTAERKTYGASFDAATMSKDMDMVVFRGSGKTALTICAPTDQAMQDYIDNSVKNWPVKNATKFKIVSIDFDSTTKLSELKAAYDSATGEGERCILDEGVCAIAKTVDDKYALIKCIGGTKYGSAWGCFILSLKTVE